MKYYYVCYEVRKRNSIGVFYAMGDRIEAIDEDVAREKFRDKWCPHYELRSPLEVTFIFDATHKYLMIQTGVYVPVKLIKNIDVCDAEVKTLDGLNYRVGRMFLEKL